MLDISKAYDCIDDKIYFCKSLKTQVSWAAPYNGLKSTYETGGKKSI